MSVEQKRVLNTAIPGPRSIELHARKAAAVAAGVGTGLPVYVERAGGGIIVDVDGNQLIDFGSGIAVASVGNAAPAGRRARCTQQVADFTHTCFMVTPYEEYVAVAEQLNELTPGDHEKRSALFNSGAEAVENAVKIARLAHRPAGGRRVRPRLPRPHQPDDGADREEHAVQAPVRPVRQRDLPGADGLPVPLADRPGATAPRRRSPCVHRPGARAGRRGELPPR